MTLERSVNYVTRRDESLGILTQCRNAQLDINTPMYLLNFFFFLI